MARLTEQEIKKQLSSGDLPNLCVIYGDEDYLKKHYVELLKKKSVGNSLPEFNLNLIDGESCTADQIYQAAQTVPFMSDYSCTVVKDLDPSKLDESQTKQLHELLEDLPECGVLVFWFDRINPEKGGKKNENYSAKSSGQKSKKFLDAADKKGVLLKLDKMRGAPLYKLLESGAQKRGCTLSRDVSTYLVNRCGDELNTLLNEIEKLCFYRSGGEITRRDVDELCIRSLDANVFDISKALMSGTAQTAFDILNDLLAQKESPNLILGTLIMSYVDMYRAAVALGSGEKSTAAMNVFNYKKSTFRLENAARNSAHTSIAQLRECLEILAQADMKLKSTALDSRRILEETMLRLMIK